MCLPLLPRSPTATASLFKPPIFPLVHLVPFHPTSPPEKQSQPWDTSALPPPARAAGPAIANYSIRPQNRQPRLLADALVYREHSHPGPPRASLELRWKSKPGQCRSFTRLSVGIALRTSGSPACPILRYQCFFIAFKMCKEVGAAEPSWVWGCKKEEIFTSVRLI